VGVKFVRLVALLAVLATTFAVLATTFAPERAKADGDPASDMLLAQSVFYPFSPAVAAGLQKTLNAEAAAANRAHFPLKVALIDSPVDLGAIPTLFGKPQQYASFLDQEISFANTKDLLLVVMPAGYGVAGLTPRASEAAASLPKPAGRQSDDLARAAFEAIPKLAAAAGHPIGAVSGASGTSKTSGGGGGANLAGVAALAAGAVVVAGVVMWLRRRRAQIR
jgi:hypothetical protein